MPTLHLLTLLALLLTAHTSASTPSNARCPRGTYSKPPICEKCPPGTYNAFKGAQGIDLCQPCPVGTFSTTPGLTSRKRCTACPAGTSSLPGSVACLRCEPGTYISALNGPPSCRPCGPPHFSAVANSFACPRCPPNSFVTMGGTACTPCPPGTSIQLGSFDACNKCNNFRIKVPLVTHCSRCPSFLRGNKRNGATKFVPCPLGTALKLPSFNGKCEPCGPEENTIHPRPRCVKDGTPCPANHFQDEKGVCRRCSRMERLNIAKKICEKCPPDTVSTGGLDTVCKKCGPNEKITVDRCTCPLGFEGVPGSCKKCPAGFRGFIRSLQSPVGERGFLGGCAACDIGTFAKKPGSSQCAPCPRGRAQPRRGQSRCEKCKRGLIASNLFLKDYPSVARFFEPASSPENTGGLSRSECVSPLTNCPKDMDRVVDSRGRFACEPRKCESGTFEVQQKPEGSFGSTLRVCLSCPAAFFLDEGQGRCRACPRGQLGLGGIRTECTRCGSNLAAIYPPNGKPICSCFNSLFRYDGKPRELVNGTCKKCSSAFFPVFLDGEM